MGFAVKGKSRPRHMDAQELRGLGRHQYAAWRDTEEFQQLGQETATGRSENVGIMGMRQQTPLPP